MEEAIFLSSLVRVASQRDIREALLLGYCEARLDEMEFHVLIDLNSSENLDFRCDS